MVSSHRATLSYFTNSLNMATDRYVSLLDLLSTVCGVCILFIRHGRVIRTALLPVISFLIQILSEKLYIFQNLRTEKSQVYLYVSKMKTFFIKLL